MNKQKILSNSQKKVMGDEEQKEYEGWLAELCNNCIKKDFNDNKNCLTIDSDVITDWWVYE